MILLASGIGGSGLVHEIHAWSKAHKINDSEKQQPISSQISKHWRIIPLVNWVLSSDKVRVNQWWYQRHRWWPHRRRRSPRQSLRNSRRRYTRRQRINCSRSHQKVRAKYLIWRREHLQTQSVSSQNQWIILLPVLIEVAQPRLLLENYGSQRVGSKTSMIDLRQTLRQRRR